MGSCGCSGADRSACPVTLLVAGIVTIILGVLAMLAPLASGLATATVIGALVVAGGIFRMALAFRASSLGKGILGFAIGAFTVLCGLLLVAHPLFGLASLALILAAYFVVDGIAEIAFSFRLKPANGWGWVLFGGIVSLLLGLSIWRQWPISGLWAIGVLVGVKLLFAGWAMIGLHRALGAFAGQPEDQASACAP